MSGKARERESDEKVCKGKVCGRANRGKSEGQAGNTQGKRKAESKYTTENRMSRVLRKGRTGGEGQRNRTGRKRGEGRDGQGATKGGKGQNF